MVLFGVALCAVAAPVLSDGLLGDALLASVNQCRALHTEPRVLALSRLQAVTRTDATDLKSWQVLDAAGKSVVRVDRKGLVVDAAVGVSDSARLSRFHRTLGDWSRVAIFEPRLQDRRKNVFAWTGRFDAGLACIIYRPERDELERVWIAESLLVP